jgi:hypothetical protein
MQRKLFRKGQLEEYKIHALNQIQFDFDPVESRWRAKYNALVSFVKEHGHARVPYNYGASSNSNCNGDKTGESKRDTSHDEDDADSNLGSWVKRQQYQYKRFQDGKSSEMTSERIQLLEDVGMVWNRREESWMDRYRQLQEYKKKYGHINVQQTQNSQLLDWVRDQRSRYNDHKLNPRQSTLTKKQVQLLEEIDLCSLDKRETKWQQKIDELLAFRATHGHCYVPHQYPKNQALSNWCKRQRQNYRLHLEQQESPLSLERIQQLINIGFEFELPADRRKRTELFTRSWEEYFAEMKKFQKDKGHLHVPKATKLGEWWDVQKKAWKQYIEGESDENSLTQDEFDKLNSLLAPAKIGDHGPSNVAASSEKTWEEWFGELLAHRIHAQTFRVPPSRIGLSHWVEAQRNEYYKYINGIPSKLTFEQISKLQNVKFPFNLKPRTGSTEKGGLRRSWEELYTNLLQYHLQHSSFEVSRDQPELHNWVQKQRELYSIYLGRESKHIPNHVLQRLSKLRRVGFPFEEARSATEAQNRMAHGPLQQDTSQFPPEPPSTAAPTIQYGPVPYRFFPNVQCSPGYSAWPNPSIYPTGTETYNSDVDLSSTSRNKNGDMETVTFDHKSNI